MLVAKLRQKAERESKQDALKDSILSNHTTKTSGAVDETVLESTGGGYVSSQREAPTQYQQKPFRPAANL